MTSSLLLILCLNLDALSYGVAYGSKKVKLNLKYIISITILSTLFFSLALISSKYIFRYLNKNTCNLINGIVLILLGISYIIPKKEKEKTPENFSFKKYFFECLIISVDAIFTALLTGFLSDFFIIFIFFYGITNFLAVFCGNLFFYRISGSIKFKLDFLSCFIFIILGFFKII